MKPSLIFLTTICMMIFLSACSQNEEEFPMDNGFIVDNHEPEMLQTIEGNDIEGADPHILLDSDGTYYMYSTGWSNQIESTVPAYKSTNLKNWESIGSVISKKPYVYTGNASDSETQYLYNFWSPDVYKMNDKYYLFATGPVANEYPTEYVDSQINISVYVSESDSPEGPFEKFVLIKPRQDDVRAPHSVIKTDSIETIYQTDYKFYNTLRVDFHLFDDPQSDKTYFTFTGYGNPAKASENGNHVIIAQLKNPEFIGDGPNPGFYYDYVPEEHVHASNPMDWPEFKDIIPVNLDKDGQVWKPLGNPFFGHPRGVTEAPSLTYQNGWYQLYFSCNTWDSPYYQIVTIFVKDLTDLEVDKRKSLEEDQIKIGRYQKPESNDLTWMNYGSGGIFKDKDGKLMYVYHVMPKGSVRYLVMKEIKW